MWRIRRLLKQVLSRREEGIRYLVGAGGDVDGPSGVLGGSGLARGVHLGEMVGDAAAVQLERLRDPLPGGGEGSGVRSRINSIQKVVRP
jgi:hypothetical protein